MHRTGSTGSGPPRILCPLQMVSVAQRCLQAVWRTSEIVAVKSDAAVEDLFDSLVGHLAGRQQLNDLPSPGWSCLEPHDHGIDLKPVRADRPGTWCWSACS